METEAKFVIPDAATFERLEAQDQLAGLMLTAPHLKVVRDVYMDTPGRALLTAGYACRRREEGNNVVVTLKSIQRADGAVHQREELEAVVGTAQQPQEWPESDLRSRILRLMGAEPLVPLVELRQKRKVRAGSRDGRAAVEVSLDEVCIQSGSHNREFRELELEVVQGGRESDLLPAAGLLQKEWHLQPEPRSKFERALAFVEETAGPGDGSTLEQGVDRNDLMAEAARKILYFHFLRLLEHEPGTRSGEDIEELHRMRVATRRMRAALTIFESYLDPAYKPFRKSLRRTGRVLGQARDLDVFGEKIRRYAGGLPAGQQSGLDPLLTAWQRESDAARAELLGYLDSAAYADFKAEFREFLQNPVSGAEPVPTGETKPRPLRVAHVLPILLYDGFGRIKAFDEWMGRPETPLVRYHQLRIASKKLRYTLEFFAEILPPDARDLIRRMKALQDHLGDLQDAVVASDVISNFLARGRWGQNARHRPARGAAPVIAPGVAAYLAYRQEEIQRLRDSFPEVWTPVRAPVFNRMLAVLVAAL